MSQKNQNESDQELKTRYSDEELEEFRQLIENKLKKAKEEYEFLHQAVKNPNDHGVAENYNSNKLFEETNAATDKESLSQLADRQRKFIKNLEDALVRIENKTYGICKETGELISKERLRAVPHTTSSIKAKQQQNK
jgi:RNA polymerase-binding transcription factor DksA